jgi:hypothetical protein
MELFKKKNGHTSVCPFFQQEKTPSGCAMIKPDNSSEPEPKKKKSVVLLLLIKPLRVTGKK